MSRTSPDKAGSHMRTLETEADRERNWRCHSYRTSSGGEQQERHPDERRITQGDRRTIPGWVTPWTPRKVKSDRKITAGRPSGRQIAKAAVDPQRAALFGMISHTGSKIRPGKTTQQRNNNKYPKWVAIFWIATPNNQIQAQSGSLYLMVQ